MSRKIKYSKELKLEIVRRYLKGESTSLLANEYSLGGTVAAPLVGQILEQSLNYLGIERDYENQIEKEYSNIFFQLIAARYEKKSTIITTNQPLSKWGEVFNDNTIATTIIDRLVHHSSVIKIAGKSYRIKDMILDESETNEED